MNTSTEISPKPYSVLELNQYIKSLLENRLGSVWVKGEISNFKAHSSGHLYLSIKDQDSQIKAVMFRGQTSRLKFRPLDGLEVLVKGQVSAYPARGEYQLYIEHMEPLGAGALQKAFEQLKNQLAKEGLFDRQKKKPIPKRPRHIAIITSPTGAAIQDMLQILKRRCPSIPVTIIPTLVQGAQAASHILEALSQTLRVLSDVDVIILGRGGGSMEDMWCFNDETLARKIAQSPIPIISAVGHEVDFTICDFVADLRAPTPSAAAELVAQSDQEYLTHISVLTQKLHHRFQQSLGRLVEKTIHLKKRLVDPKRRLKDLMLRQDDLYDRLLQAFRNNNRTQQYSLDYHMQSLKRFPQKLIPLHSRLEKIKSQYHSSIFYHLKFQNNRLMTSMQLLDSLNPLRVLNRGFSYQIDPRTNTVIKSVEFLKKDALMITKLRDGEITSRIESITIIPHSIYPKEIL
jgi:exodeoxyribonuclease VII large subunit